MRNIQFTFILAFLIFNSYCQDTIRIKTKESEISFGTFNTVNESNKVNINPSISGYLGDYYFENRYNYEAPNCASINVGKRIFKNIKHLEIIPMGGLVFGSFKGITAELQTSLDYRKYTFSTDNQFSYEYTQPDKSIYLNWTVARYKVTNSFRIGVTTVLSEQLNQCAKLDKGVTVLILLKTWSARFYAFNYDTEKRYYWLSLRYTIRGKLKRE